MNVLKSKWLLLPLLFLLFGTGDLLAQDTLRVHFLYGSRPARGYKDVEKHLFGGIHGGHVSIGSTHGIYGFGPRDRFHLVGHRSRKRRHSYFQYETRPEFQRDSVGKQYLTVFVPISKKTMWTIDSLHACFAQNSPYDYAFLGMRCAASSYDMLAYAGITKKRSKFGTWFRIFYPRKLRTRMVRKAESNGWKMIYRAGPERRVWERDLRRTRRRIEQNAIYQP